MPKVTDNAVPVIDATVVAASAKKNVVTQAMLEKIAQRNALYSKTQKAAAIAKELRENTALEFATMLGIMTMDELKATSPKAIEKKMNEALAAGTLVVEAGPLDFKLNKSSEGRYPAWKDLYIGKVGELEANKILESTPLQYSYNVVVDNCK